MHKAKMIVVKFYKFVVSVNVQVEVVCRGDSIIIGVEYDCEARKHVRMDR